MALGSNHVTTSTGATFIPEVWSDEVIAEYKPNLVLAQLVARLSHNKRKGDTIHVPVPTRGSASTKSAETEVTLIAATESEVTISINQHKEYSRLIEDIVRIQAMDSLRQFYTRDAGHALAVAVDTFLHNLGATFGDSGSAYNNAVIGSDGETAWDGSASTSTGNGAALADAGIRRVIRAFDDDDVPMDGRFMVVPPVEKESLLGINRFTEQAFTGEVAGQNAIRNGLLGDLYAVPFYVSTNVATVQADDSSTNYRAAIFAHKNSIVLVEQQDIRTQSQYKQEWLGDLFTADILFGGANVRDVGQLAIIVPA